MRPTHLIIASLLALAAPMAQAQATQRLTASKAGEYGLIYSLPLTEIDITVETEHTRLEPANSTTTPAATWPSTMPLPSRRPP